MVSIPSKFASNAYSQASKLGSPLQQHRAETAKANEGNSNPFKEMVGDTLDSVLKGGQSIETKTVDYSRGQSSIIDIVTAVAETEVAMETLVSLRDRVIEAYKEIKNMPI